jgi:glycosyltransferase involved in cell wall biosynthesis
MRIVIDMQGAQTESRFRGIGRYTLSFTQAVARNRGEHEVFLALSGLFPETIEPIRAAFQGLLPQENIRVWFAPGPVAEMHAGNEDRRQAAELIREAFLASLNPDVIHINSLFEGFGDDAITSIGRFDTRTPVSVSLFDLIPMMNSHQYLTPNPQYSDYYLRKIGWLRQAKAYLAISESAQKEGQQNLHMPQARFFNTSMAIDSDFQTVAPDADTLRKLQNKFNFTQPFLLYSGGADERKNLPRLVKAYKALPFELRSKYQLLIAGRIHADQISDIFENSGVSAEDIVFTGYVSDEELVQLYSLCHLFVLPSWHEGFGLPVLEAMACGAAVIGANTSSLPEVIGLEEALFDPFSVTDIARKLQQALTDEAFRIRLCEHGEQQVKRFSWDKTATRAFEAWVTMPGADVRSYIEGSTANSALVTALMHDNSSLSDTALADMALCVANNRQASTERQLFVDVSELCQHDAATGVQRVVRSYLAHLFQSPPAGFCIEPVYATLEDGYRYARRFTERFLGLDSEQPGDDWIEWQRGDVFFGLDLQHQVQLSNAQFYRELQLDGVTVKFLIYDLLPVQFPTLFPNEELKVLHEQWLTMIAKTDGAICISKATADLYDGWIKDFAIQQAATFHTSWVHIGGDINGATSSRGVPADAETILASLAKRPTFVCVSTLEPRKRQQQILESVNALWKEGLDVNLIFVGQQGWKVETLAEDIQHHGEYGKRLFWLKGISDEYLDRVYAASSCLIAASVDEGFGLSLIEAARHAVPIVARDIPVFREVAGDCAFYFDGESAHDLTSALKNWLDLYQSDSHPTSTELQWSTWQECTEKLKTALIEENYPRRQLLVDISTLVVEDAKTGIQRVVRNVLNEWLSNPPLGWRVEPVYATAEQPYRYARQFTAQFLGDADDALTDDIIDYAPGDLFFALDLNHQTPRIHKSFLQRMYSAGVDVKFLVYDLLPLQFPQFRDPQHRVHEVVAEWFTVVCGLGGAVCISESVAGELKEWVQENKVERHRTFKIDWFHLGADVDVDVDTDNVQSRKETDTDQSDTLSRLAKDCSFLMVGTLEPRKGHEQVLDAFEMLWQSDLPVNLVIVGKQGWMVEELADRIRTHSELNKRLFWLEGISDKYLEQVYKVSSSLIAASYGEGFGLPLIEAAQYELPIIARDIPVFREVAGSHAFYFDSESPKGLADVLKNWLALYNTHEHPTSVDMPWLTWKESVQQLNSVLFQESNANGRVLDEE